MDTARPITHEAHRRLTERRRRRSAIRRGIVVAGLCSFALAWGVIARTGPMGSTSAVGNASSSVISSSADPSVTSDDDHYGSASDDTAAAGGSSGDTEASSVTTQTS
jgi:hypothetical protein